jgi:hypothetical protein
MNKIKKSMIKRAIKKYRRIYPCGVQKDLWGCFTEMDNLIVFWFNTQDNTTHLMTMPNKQVTSAAGSE